MKVIIYRPPHAISRYWHTAPYETGSIYKTSSMAVLTNIIVMLKSTYDTYYIPEKRKFSGILCFRQQRSHCRVVRRHRRRPPPPCHNFVSAITFEGSKLRSSNLTHALLIQIYRTSSIIDIVVPSKMAAGGHFVKNFTQKKLCIDLKWPEMRSKVICGHSKCPPAAILSKKKIKNKVPYGSEMDRNAIENEFRTSKMADQSEVARNAIQSDFETSKMAAVSHFVKNFKKK